jgi:membrane-bound lytic murein transglycosylase B
VLRPAALVLGVLGLMASARIEGQQPALPAAVDAPTPATATPVIDRDAFGSWLQGFRRDALAHGISQGTVDLALGSVEPEPSVLERDRQQAEFTLDLQAYLKRRLTKEAVREARKMWHAHRALATRVGKAYGVDPRLLIAVWGLESNFGRFSGVRPSVPTLATLAFDGRRADLFKGELLDALAIVDHGDISLEKMKGSWAGALGQVQFLPSSYLAFAVDFDKDGRRDIWSSLPDVLASIANYLKGHGWTPGETWGYPVTVPQSAADGMASIGLRTEGCRAVRELTPPRPLKEWGTIGITRTGGAPLPQSSGAASLLRIEDHAWLVTGNYEALLAYNCAHTYAISVATLAAKLPK